MLGVFHILCMLCCLKMFLRGHQAVFVVQAHWQFRKALSPCSIFRVYYILSVYTIPCALIPVAALIYWADIVRLHIRPYIEGKFLIAFSELIFGSLCKFVYFRNDNCPNHLFPSSNPMPVQVPRKRKFLGIWILPSTCPRCEHQNSNSKFKIQNNMSDSKKMIRTLNWNLQIFILKRFCKFSKI